MITLTEDVNATNHSLMEVLDCSKKCWRGRGNGHPCYNYS